MPPFVIVVTLQLTFKKYLLMALMKFSLSLSLGVLITAGIPDVASAQQQPPLVIHAPAQEIAAARAVGDTSIFAPLSLPTPNIYRNGNGAPARGYWQNRVDYSISARLDTGTNSISGALLMTYHNSSPDTLDFLWLHLEQNAFRANSLNSLVFPSNSRFGARDFDGGYKFSRVAQVISSRRVPLKLFDNGTVGRIDLSQPLAPGSSTVIDLAYTFAVPEHGADRMGREGGLFQIAQWFPKAAVYDDIRGWNIDQYLGQGEFYLPYGDYVMELTVPATYIVAATGTLQNPREVLPATQVRRLELAARSDTVIRIITAAELEAGTARPRHSGEITWKFAANNVRDVAWVAAPDYQWDATSWKGIMAHAVYRPQSSHIWEDAADQTRESLIEYSERWHPYPYPQATSAEGPVYGMEYPMLAMQQGGKSKAELYEVLTHEVGHNWYPMMVGNNERSHAWMDEGFTTFINTFAEARRFPELGDAARRFGIQKLYVERYQAENIDVPVDVPPDRIDPRRLAVAAYYKPSAALHILRDEILGPEVFDEAFRAYTSRWAFRHPAPADFYRTMENVSGTRLDWFWRSWFVENAHFDQGVDSVKSASNSEGTTFVGIWYGNYARGVLPILVRLTFSDGTFEEHAYPAEVWSTNSRQYARSYVFYGKTLSKVEIDPDRRLVDKNRDNNTWVTSE